MRWLKSSIQSEKAPPLIGCFGSDPFFTLMGYDIEMTRQDVPIMLKAGFVIIEKERSAPGRIEIALVFS